MKIRKAVKKKPVNAKQLREAARGYLVAAMAEAQYDINLLHAAQAIVSVPPFKGE